MTRGRKAGQTSVLYSVWRNSDDELLILDGSVEQCCEAMGIKKSSFYAIICRSNKPDSPYTVQKRRSRRIIGEVGL